jgi:hypothetical protein
VDERRRRPRFGSSAERLTRRIEETRATPGRPLQCSECGRLSIGRATGWTMHHEGQGELYTFCADCEEREFGRPG